MGQASFTVAILRALVFAGLFFVLGTGVWTLINTYMPELLYPEENDAAANIFGSVSSDTENRDSQSAGSHINITLGDGADAALPDGSMSDPEEVGNIADLVSGAVDPAAEARKNKGLDEVSKNSYTGMGEQPGLSLDGFTDLSPEAPAAADEGSGFSINFDSFTLGGGIAGLEPFGDSFSLPPDSGNTAAVEEAPLPARKVTGNKPMALEGDFNPKDIAAGIRTVLETDKRG
jgi:hypothetical protein